MDPRIRVVTVGGSLVLLLLVVELVRRRKLKEEYSLLWVLTALTLLVLSIWYGLLARLTEVIGAVLPSSTLFFFGLLFVVVLLLHFSVRISGLERRMTALVQEVGLMNVTRRPPGTGRTELEEPPDEGAVAEQEREPEVPSSTRG